MCRPRASRARRNAAPAELGPQDLVIVAVKGPALAAVAPAVKAMLGPATRVLVAMNGVPWWFFDGLPGEGAYLNVLREGIAVDAMPTPGVYIGTNTGQLFASADEGDHWHAVPSFFPPISSVTAITR